MAPKVKRRKLTLADALANKDVPPRLAEKAIREKDPGASVGDPIVPAGGGEASDVPAGGGEASDVLSILADTTCVDLVKA